MKVLSRAVSNGNKGTNNLTSIEIDKGEHVKREVWVMVKQVNRKDKLTWTYWNILLEFWNTAVTLAHFGMAILILIFGALHRKDCPIDDRIPIVAFVTGLISLSRQYLQTIQRFDRSTSKAHRLYRVFRYDIFVYPLGIAEICAIVTSAVLVFWIFSTVNLDDPSSGDHCNSLLYFLVFSFLMIILVGCVIEQIVKYSRILWLKFGRKNPAMILPRKLPYSIETFTM